MSADYVVKTENLRFEYSRYDEDTKEKITSLALDDINLEIERGGFIAILGHNGSGKSTFAKHLNCLLTPTQGVVWVNGYDSKDEESPWLIRQDTGMVFQNPDNQIIATIVEEDVAFGPENLGVPPKEIRKRVEEALKTVGMSHCAGDAPHMLSGGQKQRVAIAGILAMKPKCIILDEPTAMLDPSGQKEVMDTIIRLNKEEKITIILITHFMEEAVNADRIIVMEKGKVVMDGVAKEIFCQVDRLKSMGLDVPLVTEISRNLRELGVDMPEGVLSIEEMVGAICQLKPKI